jgi:predicted transcriptional regulator of viral defense system
MTPKSNIESTLAGLSTQERELLQHFTATEKTTVNLGDILGLRPWSKPTANKVLSRLAKKGWLQRLKRGMYTVVPISSPTANPVIENTWPLAMEVFKPAFISGWSAAEHWGLTEQIFNTVAIVTSTLQRKASHEIAGVRFQTKVVSTEHFFGSKSEWFGSHEVQIADPSRMVVDILDMPAFGGGGRHTLDIVRNYFASEFFNPSLLLDYAKRYDRGSIFKRMGFLAEHFKAKVSAEWMDSCKMHLSKGMARLDPDAPAKGRYVTNWNIQINLPL